MFYVTTIDFATPEYDDTVQLRSSVLRQPLGLSFSETELSQEYAQTHFVCYDAVSGALLGCLLMKTGSPQVVKMRQVAVSPSAQGKGVGRMLVEASERWAKQNGFERIVLHARATAVPFYQHLLYQVTSEPFEEVTIAHVEMQKKMND